MRPTKPHEKQKVKNIIDKMNETGKKKLKKLI